MGKDIHLPNVIHKSPEAVDFIIKFQDDTADHIHQGISLGHGSGENGPCFWYWCPLCGCLIKEEMVFIHTDPNEPFDHREITHHFTHPNPSHKIKIRRR